MAYDTDQCSWYKRQGASPEMARFVVQMGQNLAIVVCSENELPTLAHWDQLHPQVEEPEEEPDKVSDSEITVEDDPPLEDKAVQPCKSSRYNKGVLPFHYGGGDVVAKCTRVLSAIDLTCYKSTSSLLDDVVLRHTFPVFTGLGWCPIVNWDFAGAVSIFGPDALPVVHQWPLPGLEPATSRVRVAAHNH